MYEFIANLFYFGFKKQLIDALKELTKICGGQYKMGIQTKLLCPRGLVGAFHWNAGRLHLVAGLSMSSMASWQHLHWNQWNVLPTAGIGFSR